MLLSYIAAYMYDKKLFSRHSCEPKQSRPVVVARRVSAEIAKNKQMKQYAGTMKPRFCLSNLLALP